MADNRYPCPECGTVLKPKNPLTAGKKIKCPKCAKVFAPVPDEEEEGGTYGFDAADDRADESTKEERQKAASPLKVRSKSARGPAQAAVTAPSNKMLGTAVITCVGAVLTIIVALWPLVFRSNKKPDETTAATSNKKFEEETTEMKTIRVVGSIVTIAFGVLAFLYNGAIAVCAVKMQSLESYTWAMAGSILIMLPFNWGLSLFSFDWFFRFVVKVAGPEIGIMLTLATILVVNLFYTYVGIWNVRVLRDPEVIAGFREEKPEG